MTKRTLVWIRRKELRLADQEPVLDAIEQGEMIAVFVLDPRTFSLKNAEQAPHRLRFLLLSLLELAEQFEAKGSQLLIVQGKEEKVIVDLAQHYKVDGVSAFRCSEPGDRKRDEQVRAKLKCPLKLYEGELLVAPEMIRNGSGLPYAVFTPFSKQFRLLAQIEKPLKAPRELPPLPVSLKDAPFSLVKKEELLALVEKLEAVSARFNPEKKPAVLLKAGEKAAKQRLNAFLKQRVAPYKDARDRMDQQGTSRLSVDLKFGTLSVREIWHAVKKASGTSEGGQAFLRQLVWRDFAYSSLWDRPTLLEEPFQKKYQGFPYQDNDEYWQAWVTGNTGYPIVDAAARELLGSGYVHNRARMISASFATKHLLIDYRRCEAHYLKFLTDGDFALNNMGWQWSAGCGCDAQPYFRVFNATTQGKKFDPQGDYVKRWVPELKKLDARSLHQPEKAAPLLLQAAGVELTKNYPLPIVEHSAARLHFLEVAKAHLK